MPKSCVMETCTDTVSCQRVFCSQNTQASIANRAIGTQCTPAGLISRSSQTGEKSPETHEQQWQGFAAAFLETVLDVDNAQVCASEEFPASRDGTVLAVESGLHTYSCDPQSSNTSISVTGSAGPWPSEL
ncbi:uncharacterized protein LOC144158590 isoform X2 [Haemaphysalis longicornis]